MTTKSEGINLLEFLKGIKISDRAIEILKTRNVSIDELIEMDIADLKLFLTQELKLDSLSKNRVLKSITKLKQNNTDTTPSTKQHVVVSPAEHDGIIKLYEQFDKSSSLSSTIQNAIQSLNYSETAANKDIETGMNMIINDIKSKKNILLKDIDNMLSYKTNLLKKQLNILTKYLTIINDGKVKYEEYINNNMDITQRKKLILKMINGILNRQGVAITLLTAPQMQFDVEYYVEKINKLYQVIEMNDCDQPKMIKLSLKKVYDDIISVKYVLNNYDVTGPKPLLEVVLEYAIAPKSYLKKKRKAKKHKKRKKKKKRSYSDDESDESENESENEYEYKYEYDINRVDIDSLKWEGTKIKIKKNRYKIDGLKEERLYLIRMRGRNSSGFGPYSNILDAVTKKVKIKFDVFNKQYVNVQHKRKGERVQIFGGGQSGCIYTLIQSSKGFKHGIKKWKIKIDPMLQFDMDMEQIGIVSEKLKQHQLTNKQITTCGHGIGSGTGLRPGDIIQIILNFKKLTVVIKKNNIICKQQKLIKGNIYYPVIQCCVCRHQLYTLI